MKVEWIEDPDAQSRERTPIEKLNAATNEIMMRYIQGDLTDEQIAAVKEYLERNICPECGR